MIRWLHELPYTEIVKSGTIRLTSGTADREDVTESPDSDVRYFMLSSFEHVPSTSPSQKCTVYSTNNTVPYAVRVHQIQYIR